jgi:hypothetical protein
MIAVGSKVIWSPMPDQVWTVISLKTGSDGIECAVCDPDGQKTWDEPDENYQELWLKDLTEHVEPVRFQRGDTVKNRLGELHVVTSVTACDYAHCSFRDCIEVKRVGTKRRHEMSFAAEQSDFEKVGA